MNRPITKRDYYTCIVIMRIRMRKMIRIMLMIVMRGERRIIIAKTIMIIITLLIKIMATI